MPNFTRQGGTTMNTVSAAVAVAVACLLAAPSAHAQSTAAGDAAVAALASPTASVSVAGLSLASIQALPGFPVAAYRDGQLHGRVVIGYQVNADGTVGDVRVLEASPVRVFTRTATGAVANWRFAATGASERRMVEFRFDAE